MRAAAMEGVIQDLERRERGHALCCAAGSGMLVLVVVKVGKR